MGKTIVEKIMAKAAGKPEVSPGDYLKFGIKDTYIQVGSDIGALNSREYERLGWDKFFDPKKVMIAPEHCGTWARQQDNVTNRESHRITKEWALSLGVPKENILDLGNVGTCHHLPIEKAGRCRAMFTFMPIPIAPLPAGLAVLVSIFPLPNPLFCGSAGCGSACRKVSNSTSPANCRTALWAGMSLNISWAKSVRPGLSIRRWNLRDRS
jgi:hypothetical protein